MVRFRVCECLLYSLIFTHHAIVNYIIMSDLKNCILILLQITAIYNATQLGWNVEFVNGQKKIILRKKIKDMTYTDHNTFKLLEVLMNLPKN